MKTLTLIRIKTNIHFYSNSDSYFHSYDNDVESVLKEKKYPLIKLEERQEINGEMFNIIHFTITPKNIIWSDSKIQEIGMDLLKNPIFIEDNPDFYDDFLYLTILKDEIIKGKLRKELGYVLYHNPENHSIKDFVGGFPLEIFFNEKVIGNIEIGKTEGYIGHTVRKHWIDKLLTEECLSVLSEDDFSHWITSNKSANFADQLEDMLDGEDNLEIARELIKENLMIIHDTALILRHPLHNGSLNSAIELFYILKDLGLMMSPDFYYL